MQCKGMETMNVMYSTELGKILDEHSSINGKPNNERYKL